MLGEEVRYRARVVKVSSAELGLGQSTIQPAFRLLVCIHPSELTPLTDESKDVVYARLVACCLRELKPSHRYHTHL